MLTNVKYWPNPAHKRETTEAGPPRWRPDKAPCPKMTVEEREDLLRRSIPLSPADPASRRFAFRRVPKLEWFEAKCHGYNEGEPEFHGHPTVHVPNRVLRAFRDAGHISEAEYRFMVKELG